MAATPSTKLQHLIYRSFLTSALIPLVVIELVLLSIYFGITHYISMKYRATLLEEATTSLQEILSREAGSIDSQLSDVTRHAVLMQRDHERFFRNPESCLLPQGEPQFRRHANGALYKSENNGGASLYYSSSTTIGPEEMRKARCSEALDPLLESIVKSTPIISQAYLNTRDNMNRLYPFMPDAPGQYGPILKMRDFNFYYEADEAHDPERRPVWTSAYLDPAGQGWMISVIVPIYNGERLEGVSGLDVTIESFIKHVLNLKMSWEAKPFLVDGRGTILAMPESVETIFGLHELTRHEYDANIRSTIEKPSEFSIFNIHDAKIAAQLRRVFDSRSRIAEMDAGGAHYLVSQEIVPETGWRLITLVDKAVIFGKIDEFRRFTNSIGYSAVALMAVFYAAFFLFLQRKSARMARKIAAPIERLTELTSTLLGTRRPPALEEVGIAEIDHLGKNFHEMGEQLDRRTRELIESRIREQHKESQAEQLEWLAITDRLTGLYNRLKLDTVLQAEIDRSRRTERRFGIMMLDIDHFKLINDTYGHQTGDDTLRHLAQLLKAGIRGTDTVGRWGGEEFMVICPETDDQGLRNLAEKLRQAVDSQTFPVIGSLTVSFGVAANHPDDGISDIIARADKALYAAKNLGRNRVETCPSLLH